MQNDKKEQVAERLYLTTPSPLKSMLYRNSQDEFQTLATHWSTSYLPTNEELNRRLDIHSYMDSNNLDITENNQIWV